MTPLLLLLLVRISTLVPSLAEGDGGHLHAYVPGDVIIGGLVPIHAQTSRDPASGSAACIDFNLRNFILSQAMIFAIEEANNNGTLPKIRIGYNIYDTCGDVWFAIRAALHMLRGPPDLRRRLLPESIDAPLPEPPTKVVIGEKHSEISIAVARILSLASVAQISYGATSTQLSRKSKFPTFVRTVPSDAHQTRSMAQLVRRFHWRSVAIVGSDDEYGKYGSDHLLHNFEDTGDVCVDFHQILSGNFAQNNSQTRVELERLMERMNESAAEAFILFTKNANVKLIMEAAIKRGLNRTWVASDTWSTSHAISNVPGIHRVGQVFGFISQQREVPGLKRYILEMLGNHGNDFVRQYLVKHPPCSPAAEDTDSSRDPPGSSSCLTPDGLVRHMDRDESYNIYLAVKVVVDSLRRLLRCDEHVCKRSTNFTTSELLKEIKKTNITVGPTHLWFNANGDPSIGHDILQWNLTATGGRIETIGAYQPTGSVRLPQRLEEEMRSVKVTKHNCSKTCEPGHELKQLERRCCMECVRCPEGMKSPGRGAPCMRCGENQFSTPARDGCPNKTTDFIRWSNPFVIILTTLDALGIISSVLMAAVFAVHRGTPIVKSVGGSLCFLELLCLLACFCLTLTFFGRPTTISCMLALPLFLLVFAVCITCILANLLQIMVGFTFDQLQGVWMRRLNYPVVLVLLSFGIQLAMFVPWLIFFRPSLRRTALVRTTLLHCDKGSKELFGAMLAYNGLLAVICVSFAFKSKRLPDLYKNASLTTISMLLFIVIWSVFIPVHINVNAKYTQVVEAAAVLISSYSVLCCHLAPKCYIMLFRSHINSQQAITEYIRKHLERKGVAVVNS